MVVLLASQERQLLQAITVDPLVATKDVSWTNTKPTSAFCALTKFPSTKKTPHTILRAALKLKNAVNEGATVAAMFLRMSTAPLVSMVIGIPIKTNRAHPMAKLSSTRRRDSLLIRNNDPRAKFQWKRAMYANVALRPTAVLLLMEMCEALSSASWHAP